MVDGASSFDVKLFSFSEGWVSRKNCVIRQEYEKFVPVFFFLAGYQLAGYWVNQNIFSNIQDLKGRSVALSIGSSYKEICKTWCFTKKILLLVWLGTIIENIFELALMDLK